MRHKPFIRRLIHHSEICGSFTFIDSERGPFRLFRGTFLVSTPAGFPLIFFVALNSESKPHKLSLEQEKILLSYPISIWMLFLLGTGFSISATQERMQLDDIKFQRALHVLDRTGLIEKEFRKDYLELVKQQIQINPELDTFQKTFEMYFTEGLLKKLKKDIESLLAKYAHQTRIEAELDEKDKTFPVTAVFFLKPFDGLGTLLNKKK